MIAAPLSPAEADDIVRAGQSPRYRELDRLQRVYDCTVYDGRPGFLDTSIDVPLQERKPCVIMPTVAQAVESHVAFALGEGKFPAILSLTNEDNSDNGGLSKPDSEKLDAFNEGLVASSCLESVSRQLLRMGLVSKSACAVLGFRKGLPIVEPIWAKCCTPTFNPQDPDEVIKLEISYRYVQQEFDPMQGKWSPAVYQYRRVIDDKTDVTYVPVRVQSKVEFPVSSTPDPAKTVKHNFGVCPVVWWRCMAGAESGIDGHAIHETILDAVAALDMSLSQRHRAALYAGDPQWIMTGVDPDQPVGPSGRRARMAAIAPDNPTGDPSKAGPWASALYGYKDGGATKKGPGVVWASENPEAEIKLVTLPGEALSAVDQHAQDLLNKVCEAMFCVRLDPVALRGTADISAKAMVLLYAKQLARVAQLRSDFGEKCLKPLLSLFYRLILAVPAGVFVPGTKAVTSILAKSSIKIAGGASVWFAPKLLLKWPDYFEPSDADENTRVANAKLAFESKLITRKSAVEHLKGVFGISNVDQYLDTLEKEVEERQREAMATQQPLIAGQKPPANAAKDKEKVA